MSPFFSKLKNASEILRSIGEIAALVLLTYKLHEYFTEGIGFWFFWGTVAFLFVAILINIFAHVYTERYRRNATIAKMLPYVNDAFTEIHTVLGNESSLAKDYINAFEDFCNRISQAFSQITGHHCHVSIKISTGSDSATFRVVTIARENILPTDLETPSRAALDTTTDEKFHHYFSDNTDFTTILRNIRDNHGKRYFFCNDLPKHNGYKNSSLRFHKIDPPEYNPRDKFWTKKFWSEKQWKIWDKEQRKEREWLLPYKSTLVGAIYPSITRTNPEDPITGFLCIDCNKKGVFIEKDDRYLLAGCANGLFNAIERYKGKAKEEAKQVT